MISFISWCWVGLIFGVSFIATPAKFLAPSLSLAHALEVGRATFNVFMWVECLVGAVLLFALFLVNKTIAYCRPLVLSLALIMLVQYTWLLPRLDARVDIILQGGVVSDSPLHWLYILVEFGKIAILLLLGMLANRVSQSAS